MGRPPMPAQILFRTPPSQGPAEPPGPTDPYLMAQASLPPALFGRLRLWQDASSHCIFLRLLQLSFVFRGGAGVLHVSQGFLGLGIGSGPDTSVFIKFREGFGIGHHYFAEAWWWFRGR